MKQFKFNERQRFSIRKFSIGAASVLLGSAFFAVSSVEDVQAAEQSQNVVSVNENKQTPDPLISSNSSTTGVSTKEANTSVSDANVENKPEGDVVGSSKETQESVPVVSTISDSNERKLALSKLIEEIDGKFTNGKYASKTEESVNQLKATLEEAKSVLSNATTESELTQAHSKLVTATTKLQTKPEEKKQAPAVDTTNGKATVGIKATNTEKASDSNSISNSGSRDERHGKALDRSNLFRTDPATTDTDPSANQTYTAPAENADLKTLADKLLGLGATVENNTKLANEMNALGDSKQVEKGTVKEINEFGGWKAVDGGVFAIARRTEEGVYPLETINSTLNDTVWLREQAFDRDTEYTLLLSKSRTRANRNEEVFDGSNYRPTGEGSGITKNVAKYKGIEKIFTAYSTAEGSDIIVKFKPGYVGDSDGFKANYKVQVYSITGNQESLVYETTFDPSRNINDDKKIVTKATDGTNAERIKISNASNSTTIDAGVDNTTRPGFIGKREAEKLMAQPKNLPNGKSGTFTSKPIALPQGADHYKVRISLADPNRTGMSYQAWDEKYSIPVTGADFSIAQDTTKVAKSLLQKVYDKLLETVDKDKKGKTPETQAAYQAQLDAIKEALTPGKYTSTKNYQELLKFALEKQEKLKVDKSALTTSKGELDQLVDDDPTPGKTPETVSEYNIAKSAAEEEARKAKLIIDDEHATVDQVAQAVADVKAKRAELKAARALLVVAATEAQKTKLQNDSNALTEADKTGKTPKSIAEYEKKYETLKAALTAAKAQAKEVLDKTENAGKVEATDAQIEVDKIKAELDKAAALLKDKGNTAELEKAKNDLSSYITQQTNANVTDGKTKDSQDAYAVAKNQADQAITDAATVINSENSTVEDVASALADIKAKKAALEAAKQNLVPAATEAQKEKLENTVAKLVKASTDGKTQDSVNAYETAYTNLTAELEAAKAKATAVKTAGDNASRLEALAAQEAVDAVLAKLEAAKATLVDKATDDQVAELRKADTALTPAEGSTFEATKTPASIAAYKNAVDAIQTQLTEAKAKAADLVTKAGQNNATKAEAAAAIAKVEELKVELAKANALLKDKANTGDLAAAKEELKALAGEANVTDGKTTSTTEAYDAAKQAADAAVAAAENIINNADSTPEQVADALTTVKAKKAELEKAKAALVDKATDAQKAKLEADAAKLVQADTTGKTQDSIDAYNEKYTQLATELEAAKAKAAAVKAAGDNASRLEALTAQEAVDAVQAKLEAAKAVLVEKATDEQKAELEKADAALTPAEASTFETTKTPASIAAYKNAVDAIQTQLTEAKAKAADLVTKAGQNNATKAEAAAAIAKVEELKVELAKANALLKDKANTGDLAAAKEELKALAGEANVTDGKTTSTTEAYDAAKQAADAAVAAAENIINNADSTPEQVADALTTVKAKKAELEKAKAALVDKITQDQKDDLANAEENLKLADTTGKTKDSIKAYNDEVAKLSDELAAAKQAAKDLLDKGDNAGELEAYRVQAKINKLKSKLAEAAKLLKDIDKSAAKKEVEDAAKKATDAIVANNDLTPEQKEAAKAKVADAANKANAEIDKATTENDVTVAKNAGKFAIEKEAAKAEVEATKAAKEKAINANDKLSDDEKRAANEAIAKAADAAEKAIDAATDQATVEGAKTTGIKAVTAVNPVGKEKALDAIQKATEDKLAEIDKNDKLSAKEKAEAKAKVAKAAIDAVNAIIAATDQTAVDSAQTTGTTAVATVNPVGKEKALAEIDKALAAKEKAIEANDKLSDAEKQAAKEVAKKAADEAKKSINDAQNQEAVDNAKNAGTTAVEAVNPVGKEKALDAIQKATEDKLAEIDRDDKLSEKEKAKAKAEVAKAAIDAVNAINEATDQAAVDAKQAEGTKAVSEVNPVGKDKAKAEIEATKAEKTKAVEANPDLTDAQKAEAKAKIAEEAKKAIDAIDKAKTTEEVASAKESGKLAIEKEAEKAEIEAAKAAKEKAIDARTDLTDDEKAKAKAKVAEEAKKAIEAIENAKTHNDASAKTETGKDDIKKINPIGGKETAKKAIDEALAAKEKAIDARTDLLPEEKEAAKKAAREEAEAAKNAIDKATTSDDIKKVLDNGLDKIAKVNPLGAKEEAKKSIEERLADKEKEIDARTDLTPEEKAKAKALAREEAKAAKDAIDKATSIEAIEKALRPFLYQIDQDALVFDRPALDIETALQASVTGVVTVERGKVISQADIISKLNLPETVTVMNIDLPDTTTLGRKFAKVTLRLPGGKETTVNVPVEVTPQKNKDVIPSYNGGNDGNSGNNAANNTDAKVNKAKLEGAIHQLDELIIKESAKLDAETAKEANDLLADAKKVFVNADASQAEVDAMVKRIEDFMAKVAPATNHVTPANDQAAQTPAVAPATTQAAANARKAAKELPNTGTADSTVAMVAAAASALLGLGLAGRRRKEDEEA